MEDQYFIFDSGSYADMPGSVSGIFSEWKRTDAALALDPGTGNGMAAVCGIISAAEKYFFL